MAASHIDKSALEGVLGLSCIENYVLAAFSENSNHAYLYSDSYVSAAAAFKETIADRVGFAFIQSIPRIQRTAMQEGLIESKVWRVSDIRDAFIPESYTCVEARPEWFKGKYREGAWRDDHYILIEQKSENDFLIVNDTPRDEAIIGLEEAAALFAGGVFSFTVLDAGMKDRGPKFLERFLDKLPREDAQTEPPPEIPLICFRDFLGAMKISRRRVAQFCGKYFDAGFMSKFLEYLDKCFVSLEYMRLRNRQDEVAIREMLSCVLEGDAETLHTLKKSLGGDGA